MTDRQPPTPTADASEIQSAISGIPRWRHRIQIGQFTTPGTEDTDGEMARLALEPSYEGLRVLDIGCSDGIYSFEVERRGATEVLAIDDESSLLAGGVNGFTVAKKLLNSNVSYQVMTVDDLDPSVHGRFDRVLFVNVLYHLKNPLVALERIHDVTRPGGQMMLKSYYQTDIRKWIRGRCYGLDIDRRPKFWFYPSTELGGDPTNWFGPNRRGLEALLAAAGWEFEHHLTWADRLYYRCTKGM